MAELNFDATNVEPNQPFEVIPAGKYRAQIVASEMQATKAGDGQFLLLEFDILDGEYQGRKQWDRLNLKNPSQETVDIAQRTLSAICHAVGELQVSNSEQLHFRPMIITVRVKPKGPDKHGIERDARNEIRGYEAVGGASPTQQALKTLSTPAAAVPTTPAAATKQPPWRTAKTA